MNFSRKANETRLKWTQRLLREIETHAQYREFLKQAKLLILKDADSMELDVVRMTMDPDPNLSGRPCWFYQFNGSNKKKCNHDFIHPSRPFREILRIFENSRKGFDIQLFMNICQLCYNMRKGGAEHPLFSCEMMIDLDCYDEDPVGHQMITMRHKNIRYENPDDNKKTLVEDEDAFVDFDLDEDIARLEMMGRVE